MVGQGQYRNAVASGRSLLTMPGIMRDRETRRYRVTVLTASNWRMYYVS